MAEPTTLIGLGALIISNIGVWIHELKKRSNNKSSNGDLTLIKNQVIEIDEKVDNIDKNVAEVNAELRAFGRTCRRMNGEIKTNREDIKKLIANVGHKNKE